MKENIKGFFFQRPYRSDEAKLDLLVWIIAANGILALHLK